MTEHILADITTKRADSYFHANSDVLKQMNIVFEQQQLEKRNQQAAAQQQKIAASASNNNNGPDICMCAHCVEQMNKHLQWEQQQQQKLLLLQLQTIINMYVCAIRGYQSGSASIALL